MPRLWKRLQDWVKGKRPELRDADEIEHLATKKRPSSDEEWQLLHLLERYHVLQGAENDLRARALATAGNIRRKVEEDIRQVIPGQRPEEAVLPDTADIRPPPAPARTHEPPKHPPPSEILKGREDPDWARETVDLPPGDEAETEDLTIDVSNAIPQKATLQEELDRLVRAILSHKASSITVKDASEWLEVPLARAEELVEYLVKAQVLSPPKPTATGPKTYAVLTDEPAPRPARPEDELYQAALDILHFKAIEVVSDDWMANELTQTLAKPTRYHWMSFEPSPQLLGTKVTPLVAHDLNQQLEAAGVLTAPDEKGRRQVLRTGDVPWTLPVEKGGPGAGETVPGPFGEQPTPDITEKPPEAFGEDSPPGGGPPDWPGILDRPEEAFPPFGPGVREKGPGSPREIYYQQVFGGDLGPDGRRGAYATGTSNHPYKKNGPKHAPLPQKGFDVWLVQETQIAPNFPAAQKIMDQMRARGLIPWEKGGGGKYTVRGATITNVDTFDKAQQLIAEHTKDVKGRAKSNLAWMVRPIFVPNGTYGVVSGKAGETITLGDFTMKDAGFSPPVSFPDGIGPQPLHFTQGDIEPNSLYTNEHGEMKRVLLPPRRWAFVVEAHKREAVDLKPEATLEWRGLTIALEVLGGQTRFPDDKHPQFIPPSWVGLGYFDGIPAEDGDNLDVIVGPGDIEGPVFLAVQAVKGQFRQWKVFLGFRSEAEAEAAFKLLWKSDMFGGAWEIPPKKFKKLVLPRLMLSASREPAPPRLYKSAARLTAIPPNEVEPPHHVKNERKYSELTEALKTSGWSGRPILAYLSGGQVYALTGSHRIAAARQANLPFIPVFLIEESDFADDATFTALDEAEDNYARLRALEDVGGDAYALMLEEVARKNKAKGWSKSSLKQPDAEEGEKAGVFLRLPDAIANDFPPKPEDPSPPHFTLLYLGPVDPSRFDELADVIANVAEETAPFTVELGPEVEWFQNDKGQWIAHKGVDDESVTRMRELHVALRAAAEAAGFEIKHREGPFNPHATLAYLDEKDYTGPNPKGAFPVDQLEVWGFTKDIVLPLGVTVEKAARLVRTPGAFTVRSEPLYKDIQDYGFELVDEEKPEEEEVKTARLHIVGDYGGPGPFELPDDHIAAIRVPNGGSTCSNCTYLGEDGETCKSAEYAAWNGGDDTLIYPADEMCSDWYKPKRAEVEVYGDEGLARAGELVVEGISKKKKLLLDQRKNETERELKRRERPRGGTPMTQPQRELDLQELIDAGRWSELPLEVLETYQDQSWGRDFYAWVMGPGQSWLDTQQGQDFLESVSNRLPDPAPKRPGKPKKYDPFFDPDEGRPPETYFKGDIPPPFFNPESPMQREMEQLRKKLNLPPENPRLHVATVVPFDDHSGTPGRLPIEKVKAGDIVSVKHSGHFPDDADDDVYVQEGSSGKVVSVQTDGPRITVSVPGEVLLSDGAMLFEARSIAFRPDDIVVMVHPQDPRIKGLGRGLTATQSNATRPRLCRSSVAGSTSSTGR